MINNTVFFVVWAEVRIFTPNFGLRSPEDQSEEQVGYSTRGFSEFGQIHQIIFDERYYTMCNSVLCKLEVIRRFGQRWLVLCNDVRGKLK